MRCTMNGAWSAQVGGYRELRVILEFPKPPSAIWLSPLLGAMELKQEEGLRIRPVYLASQ
jgi:hypothetical protein